MQPLVRVNGLHYSYHDGSGRVIPALNGLDFTVNQGEFISIIGSNGSGKSTLARHLNGLLLPTGGEVQVNAKDTRDPASWRDLRRTIAMVFQHPESQAVATTVEEDVAFGPENIGIPSAEIRQRVDLALEAVGLGEFHQRAPHHLSGGQKQRLALAGVLALHPRCIILDEATSMLDPSGRRGFKEIIHRLHAQGVTIVMITQDMDEAAMSERVVVLSQGKIHRDGTTREVMTDEKFLQSVGLDIPVITRLAHELHTCHPDFRDNILTVNEIVGEIKRFSDEKSGITNGSVGKICRPVVIPHLNNLSLDHKLRERIAKTVFIDARDLGYTYMRGTPLETNALQGVSFTVHEGEIVGVIGATGSGKSTLLQHLNGLLTPQYGELRIGNKLVTDKRTDIRAIRQQVALLFQQPEDQLFERYVADDIAYGPINLGLPVHEVRLRVERAMEAVGLPVDVFRDRSIYSLSGGERRRAALAGVLALEPKVLVLDEASAGLDPRGRRELLEMLRIWQAQDERSIIWASHSMEEIAQIAGRVTVMANGRVVLDDTPQRVFKQAENLTSYGLDIPQIVQVIRGVSQTGLTVPEGVLNFNDAVVVLEYLLK